MESSTLAIDAPFARPDAYGALSMPVYHTAAYEFDTAAHMADAFTGRVLEPDYSRVMNPTVMYLEDKVKQLTGASNVFAFNSGMAAISNLLMALADSGKRVVTSNHLFGNSLALLTGTLRRFGVEAVTVDLTNLQAVEEALNVNTCCLFLEVITNPQMEVADLQALAELAHAKGVPLVADTTMIPFTAFSAHALGVDVEVVSSTKYLSGGGTGLGGLVIDYGTCARVNERIRGELLFNLGAYMTPQAAYMQSLGLETLKVRYEAQSAAATWIAQQLEKVEGIRPTSPALPSHPQHELALRQFAGAQPAMLTIDLPTEEACYRFIDRLQLVHRATNLFENKSLAIHPYSTIFGLFTAEQKAAMDVRPTCIRLSIGLEDPHDILNDILQAAHV